MTAPEQPPTFRQEALDILAEWQTQIAADRAVNPTEASGAELYNLNKAIVILEDMV